MAATDKRAQYGEQPAAQGVKSDLGDEQEIDLLALLYRLLERIKYIVAAALAGALISTLVTIFLITPMYEATSKLYVMNSSDSAVNLADLQIGAYLANDYQDVFKTWEVHEMVVQNLGLDYSYTRLQNMLTISNPNNTRILYITVKSPSPAEAAALANEYANVAKKFISETMATEEPNIFSVALEPKVPSSPNKTRNIIIGFMLGAILACGLFTLQFVMDDRIRTSDDIEKYIGLPTLAVIPDLTKRPRTRAYGYAPRPAEKTAEKRGNRK